MNKTFTILTAFISLSAVGFLATAIAVKNADTEAICIFGSIVLAGFAVSTYDIGRSFYKDNKRLQSLR